jgi:hypothetical protein
MSDELTITQVRTIIGWSYPTAFEFARDNGRQDRNGKWFVPFDLVAAEVQRRVIEAQKMQERLVAQSGNGRAP